MKIIVNDSAEVRASVILSKCFFLVPSVSSWCFFFFFAQQSRVSWQKHSAEVVNVLIIFSLQNSFKKIIRCKKILASMITKINFNRQKSQKDVRKARLKGVYKASLVWSTKRTQRLPQFLANRPRGRNFKFRALWHNHNWLMNKDLFPGIGKPEKENQ